MNFKHIHQTDQAAIDEMYERYAPVFILSTGRSGSKFLAALLDRSPNLAAFHEPPPTLAYFSHYAWRHQDEQETLVKMAEAARMESVLKVFIQGQVYVESNQCLGFFAPALGRLFKNARFVHVVRHPGDFIRSAVRKGWHKNDSLWESGRVKMADEQQWASLDQIRRLAWVWATTHAFIEAFRRTWPPARSALFRMEDLVTQVPAVQSLLRFAGGEEIPAEVIREAQQAPLNELHIQPDEPPNMKKVRDFPHYLQWDGPTRDGVGQWVEPLAVKYGYSFAQEGCQNPV